MPTNYNDERFAEVESDKRQALSELEQTYAGIISQSDKYYQAQIDASKQWADKQSQLQQENTDFTIEQIEQQKQQTQKDYTKEQSGAYVDWQKQSNQYGVNAENMAAGGMAGTGYSESSQVSMYNTYQNRVATAREVYNQAVLSYNNAIKEARLQNNSILAEIAYQALQQQLELSLQGFQYKNQLILDKQNKKTELENTYYGRYMDVLNQINTENALAEEIRQYNQNYQFQLQQFEEQKRQYDLEYQESVRQFNEEIARLKAKDAEENKREIQKLELQKQQLAEEKRQYDASLKLQQQKLEEEKRQYDKDLAEKQRQYNASLAEEQRQYNTSLAEQQKQTATINKSSGVSSSSTNASSSGRINGGSSGYEVNTPYYQGALNKDAKTYGTFSNGYQPKGISGYGKVIDTGDTYVFTTTTLAGESKNLEQTLWKTSDGSLWYWEGRQNKYVRVGNLNAKNVKGVLSTGGGGGSTNIMKVLK